MSISRKGVTHKSRVLLLTETNARIHSFVISTARGVYINALWRININNAFDCRREHYYYFLRPLPLCSSWETTIYFARLFNARQEWLSERFSFFSVCVCVFVRPAYIYTERVMSAAALWVLMMLRARARVRFSRHQSVSQKAGPGSI